MSWTAGTTYYILLDDEDLNTGAHSFYIDCPPACVTCPTYNYDISPTASWQTHSSSHIVYGCQFYRVSVTSGQPYIFKTGCGDGATADYDTYLELYSSSCNLIGFDDEHCGLQRSLIDWTATYTGYAFLKVMGWDDSFGNYTLAYIMCAPPGQSGPIAGPYEVYEGSTNIYGIGPVPGATSYTWTLPSDWSGSSTTTTITATAGSSPGGAVTVQANNACGSGPVESLIVAVLENTVPLTRDLQNITVSTGEAECYDATQTITVAGNGTTFTVQNDGDVTLIAGENIFLMPGTMVHLGGHLLALINPSGPFCGARGPTILSTQLPEEEVLMDLDMNGDSFIIYPNPTTGRFTMLLNEPVGEEPCYFQLISVLGNRVLNQRLEGTDHFEFDLSSTNPGIYIVRLTRGDRVETKKLVKH